MNKQNPSILVAGGGAIGGITAALLKKASRDIEIVVRDEAYASLIREKGIEISGTCGNHVVRIPAYSSISDIKEKKDIIILATKATGMIDAALSLKTILGENGYLISLQNGICEDDLVSVIGKNGIIGCVTGWGATMERHGKLIMTSKGDFILGYPDREPDDFLSEIATILSSVVPSRVTTNIIGNKYSKLIINSCITSLGAICGLYLGEMLAIRKIRRIFIEIIREAVLVADKMNLRIEVFSGRLDFREFIKNEGFAGDFKRHLLIRAIGLKYRRLKSSALQSLERGQKTEINYLNGFIVKHGNELGVEVPVNSAIVDIVHDIEEGRRQISIANFNDPFFNRFN
ncbi:MAG TPA: 2-dehydropantoate 2-reductase [Bacteroidales bacterium]|nr:2-dehydropantoate 2-reductase [Bacteroidales bacterium]